jgi:hypothetical protein
MAVSPAVRAEAKTHTPPTREIRMSATIVARALAALVEWMRTEVGFDETTS